MMRTDLPKEGELLYPVLSLFNGLQYTVVPQAKLSRKRIDILLIPRGAGQWIAVELKVRDWKRALWQAAANTQVADISYVALWETNPGLALEQKTLFERYGVGIISVSHSGANIVREGICLPSATRSRQQKLVLDLLTHTDEKDGCLGALSLLPT